jgi:hypothetical protein
MRRKLFVSCLTLCAATLILDRAAFAAENWVGSWKLNAAKSKAGAAPTVRAQTIKFESTAAGIKLTSDGTDADGKPMHGEYTSKFDGKDVPWTGNPSADTACPKRLDDNSYENVWKKGGKPTVNAKVVVSADGKTLTVTQTPADGKGAASVAVYDRQ